MGHEDLTSSPPSSSLSLAVLSECPTKWWQLKVRVALVAGLNPTPRHDWRQPCAPCFVRPNETLIPRKLRTCQVLVRFCAYLRIKPHAPLLVRVPSIHLSFNLAVVLPRRCVYCFRCDTENKFPTSNTSFGMDWYLILRYPCFRSPCCTIQKAFSQLVFFLISTNLTLTRNSASLYTLAKKFWWQFQS